MQQLVHPHHPPPPLERQHGGAADRRRGAAAAAAETEVRHGSHHHHLFVCLSPVCVSVPVRYLSLYLSVSLPLRFLQSRKL